MTEKPLRQSFSAAVKAPLRSETSRSAFSSRPPVKREAPMGKRKKTQEITVMAGLYESIMSNAPTKVTALAIRSNCVSRYPVSTLAVSWEEADR